MGNKGRNASGCDCSTIVQYEQRAAKKIKAMHFSFPHSVERSGKYPHRSFVSLSLGRERAEERKVFAEGIFLFLSGKGWKGVLRLSREGKRWKRKTTSMTQNRKASSPLYLSHPPNKVKYEKTLLSPDNSVHTTKGERSPSYVMKQIFSFFFSGSPRGITHFLRRPSPCRRPQSRPAAGRPPG